MGCPNGLELFAGLLGDVGFSLTTGCWGCVVSCCCRGCDNKMDGNQPLLETSLKSGPEAFLHTDQREGNEYHADKRPGSVWSGLTTNSLLLQTEPQANDTQHLAWAEGQCYHGGSIHVLMHGWWKDLGGNEVMEDKARHGGLKLRRKDALLVK